MKTLQATCGYTGCINQVIGNCDYCGIPLCESHARELKQGSENEIFCGGCYVYLQTSGLDKRTVDRRVIPNILLINSKKCTGCRSCEFVCSFEHFHEFSYELSAIRVLKFEERAESYPMVCLHCENPLCVDACPTKALFKNDIGMVILSEKDCILCEECIKVCPHRGIFFNHKREKLIKCDLCGGDPACAKICAPEAVEWIKKYKVGEKRKVVLDMNPYLGEEKIV